MLLYQLDVRLDRLTQGGAMEDVIGDFEALYQRCQTALDQLRDASENSEYRSSDGRYGAISGRSALSAVGIRGDKAREVRHYLRGLGVAKAVSESEHASNLWYWEISFENGVEREALQELTVKKPWKPRAKARTEVDPSAIRIAELTAKVADLEAKLGRYEERYGKFDDE